MNNSELFKSCRGHMCSYWLYLERWDALSLSDPVCPVRRCHWSHWILLEEIADCIWAVPHWCLLRCDGETVMDFFSFSITYPSQFLVSWTQGKCNTIDCMRTWPKLALRKYISLHPSDALQADNSGNISCMLQVDICQKNQSANPRFISSLLRM